MKYIAKMVLVGLTIVVSVVSVIGETKAAEKRMVIYASHPTKLVDYFVDKFKEKIWQYRGRSHYWRYRGITG